MTVIRSRPTRKGFIRSGAGGGTRVLDFRNERGVLVVDDHDAVVTNRDADVAAGTLQHVHRAGDLDDFDLDFAEVLGLGRQVQGEKEARRIVFRMGRS